MMDLNMGITIKTRQTACSSTSHNTSAHTLIASLLVHGGSDSKEFTCNAEDPGSIPGSGRSPSRRKWQPTPVFLPGEFLGQRSLTGYSPWGCKASDTTERLTHKHTHTFWLLRIQSRGWVVWKDVRMTVLLKVQERKWFTDTNISKAEFLSIWRPWKLYNKKLL